MTELYKNCCAVLLRGGKSRRMGRDKASLPWDGATFLQAVASAMEMFPEKYLSVASVDPDSSAASGNPDRGDISSGRANLKADESSPGTRSTDGDGLSTEWVRLPDLIPDCGPLGGIYTALQTCGAEWALVASCDIPAVKQRFFAMLLENRTEDADIVYPLTPDGRRHMTCALYRKSIAPILGKQIEKGDLRLRVLCELCRAKAVSVETPDLLQMLTNINTEEELRKITAT